MTRAVASSGPAVLPGAAPEALLAAVVEACEDAVFACDPSGVVVSWSGPAARLFGRPREQVLGRTLALLWPEHLRGEVVALTGRVLAGDTIRHHETEVARSDGMPLSVSMSLWPVPGAAGAGAGAAGAAAVGLLVVVRDVTERRVAQAALAEVEARAQEQEAATHVGSWLWDLRTGAVQWSAEFHRIHGVDPLEFDGTLEAYLGAVDRDDRDRLGAALAAAAAAGRGLQEQYRVPLADGHRRLVRVRAEVVVGSAGTPVGLRGTGYEPRSG